MRVIATAVLFFTTEATAFDGPVTRGNALVFDGSGIGAISDGLVGGVTCGDGNGGTPLLITFAVVIPPGNEVEIVETSVTLTHTFAGDLTATLLDPSGTRQVVLFGRVGATTAAGCGDSSNLSGLYVFADTAQTSGFWQAAAAAATSDAVIAADRYRSTNSGGAGATNPMPPTAINAAYSGMTSEQATGTWTLRVVDSGDQDLGTITEAKLYFFVAPNDFIFTDGFELTN